MRERTPKSRAHATWLLLAGLAALLPSTSPATSTGISGVSGKSGFICTTCHFGGMKPLVSFSGPTTMQPGDTATFRFTVQSQSSLQVAAGLDVAASQGTLAI